MKLDNISAQIRPRSGWESIDLGFKLVHAWWREVFAAHSLVFWPLALGCFALLFYLPWLAFLLLWILKPLYDRVILFVLSRRLFGEPTTIRTVLSALPGLWRFTLFGSLVLFRLDTARSLRLPIWQLEGLRTGSAQKRFRTIARNAGPGASWLTYLALKFETISLFAVIGSLWILIPEQIDVDLSWFDGNGVNQEALQMWEIFYFAAYAFAVWFVEPFYVAAGFTLYLNARTQIEAWDIELDFRRLAQRLASQSKAAVLAVLLGILPLCVTPFQYAFAEPLVDVKKAREDIEHVMQTPELKHQEKQTFWQFRDDEDDKKVETELPFIKWLVELFDQLGLWMGKLFEILLYAALIAGVYYLWRLAKKHLAPDAKPYVEPPPLQNLTGLRDAQATLPQDILSAAKQLMSQGDIHGALSLLYRGMLQHFSRRFVLHLPKGATESDFLRAIRKVASSDVAHYATKLTRAWVLIAYAQRAPSATDLNWLCDEWPKQVMSEA